MVFCFADCCMLAADLLLSTYVELHGVELSLLVQQSMAATDWLSLPVPAAPQPVCDALLQRLARAAAEVGRLLESTGRQQGGPRGRRGWAGGGDVFACHVTVCMPHYGKGKGPMSGCGKGCTLRPGFRCWWCLASSHLWCLRAALLGCCTSPKPVGAFYRLQHSNMHGTANQHVQDAQPGEVSLLGQLALIFIQLRFEAATATVCLITRFSCMCAGHGEAGSHHQRGGSVSDALESAAVERGVAKLFRGKVTPFGSAGLRFTQSAALSAIAIVGLKSLLEHTRLLTLGRGGECRRGRCRSCSPLCDARMLCSSSEPRKHVTVEGRGHAGTAHRSSFGV